MADFFFEFFGYFGRRPLKKASNSVSVPHFQEVVSIVLESAELSSCSLLFSRRMFKWAHCCRKLELPFSHVF
jgi:hypothetical protein